jgi:hypothetical protein
MRVITFLAVLTMTLPAQRPPAKDDWNCVIRRGNPAVQMWRAIREALLGKSGDAYMEQLKTATLPALPATIHRRTARKNAGYREDTDIWIAFDTTPPTETTSGTAPRTGGTRMLN